MMVKKIINGVVYAIGRETTMVIGHTKDIPTNVEICADINGKPVVGIATDAFSYCRSLTNITLPNSIKSIGIRTFYKCSSLTSIIIPDGIKTIGECAFWGCTSLTNITIPDSVDYIGTEAFWITDPVNTPIIKFIGTSTTFKLFLASAFCIRLDGFSVSLTVECSDETIII